jgi:hypothetical protein
VKLGANGKKVGEGNLEKTAAAQCGQLTIGCSGRRIRAAAEPKRVCRAWH